MRIESTKRSFADRGGRRKIEVSEFCEREKERREKWSKGVCVCYVCVLCVCVCYVCVLCVCVCVMCVCVCVLCVCAYVMCVCVYVCYVCVIEREICRKSHEFTVLCETLMDT